MGKTLLTLASVLLCSGCVTVSPTGQSTCHVDDVSDASVTMLMPGEFGVTMNQRFISAIASLRLLTTNSTRPRTGVYPSMIYRNSSNVFVGVA